MADDTRWQISELQDRITNLQAEMERRGEWLIHAIWNVMRHLERLARYIIVFAVIVVGEIYLWWQLLIAIAIIAAWGWFEFGRSAKLEADDKIRIARH